MTLLKCPKCNGELETCENYAEELKLSQKERYILNLRKKRYALRSIDKYLKAKRASLGKHYCTPEFDFLIAVESIYRYLCNELDELLVDEGQNKV